MASPSLGDWFQASFSTAPSPQRHSPNLRKERHEHPLAPTVLTLIVTVQFFDRAMMVW